MSPLWLATLWLVCLCIYVHFSVFSNFSKQVVLVIKRERVGLTFIYSSLDKNHMEVHVFPVFEDYFRLQSAKNSGVRENKILGSEPYLDFK